ncbi:hypothetical protein PRZ48_003452 [Zasmidium cellare]|uniref:Unsaturated glucuronyl hydrolase n=1 Tax=Zasmidium cellare TaxID=395010 RepID=A0ABR0EV41_ZASCE|nr:hypothetical protein PRZ48_003452 [Zasmidium cellare]
MASIHQLQTAQIIGTICLLLIGLVSILWTTTGWRPISRLPPLSPLQPDHSLATRAEDAGYSNVSTRALIPYQDSVRKGRDFLCALEQPNNANPRAIKQSTWTSEADLSTYGWNLRVDVGLGGIFGLEAAFSALGIPSVSSEWRTVNIGHNTRTARGNSIYPATFAQFLTLFHGNTRTMVARMSYGPAFKAAQMSIPVGGNNKLPPLQRWSDLIWLAWQRVTSYPNGSTDQRLLTMRAGLEHIFRYQVSNKDTKDTVLRAHGRGTISDPNEMPPVWPGWEFRPSSDNDAFKSILSSPNVYGVVYLLASHKASDQFKVRTIDRINAFNCPFSYCLLHSCRFIILNMNVLGYALASLVLTCSALQNARIQALYDENVEARIWRTALTGAPREGEVGWPQYTQGAHNNTPSSDVKPGTYVDTDAEGWTAGFFPDSLWQLYRRRTSLLSSRRPYKDEPSLDQWLSQTQAWTDPLITNVNLTNTHDIGFLAKPFESALNYNNETKYLFVLGQMSLNLASRYIPAAGVIRSWDTNNQSYTQRGSHEDSVLVIIDNMMNLALLARSAATYTHNETLLDIAISHANRTRDHHFRSDGSSFHVCDYSGTTGELYLCRTGQGLADNSTWARGQAWAIYGFAEIYSFTGDESYLQTSIKAANWFLDHLPRDGVPFWDFDAPFLPNVTPRDSSAATIAASGMLLLQDQIDKKAGKGGWWRGRGHWNGGPKKTDYRGAAIKLLKNTLDLTIAGEITYSSVDATNPNSTLGSITDISTPANTAASQGFESILLHATANNNPNAGYGRSYDTGLVYGDFYLIEAGNRLLRHESHSIWGT